MSPVWKKCPENWFLRLLRPGRNSRNTYCLNYDFWDEWMVGLWAVIPTEEETLANGSAVYIVEQGFILSSE